MDETGRRLAVAQRIADRLGEDPRLRAAIVVGSVARGTSDERSDLDLLNYYAALPEPAAFDAVLASCGAEKQYDLGPPGPEGFVAGYRVDGIDVQTGGQLVSLLEKQLDGIAGGEVNWATAKIATGILEALPLRGEDLLRAWRDRITYPDDLRRREITANLGIFPIWSADLQLAQRDAQLFRRQMLIEGAFRVLAILSAVNRTYFSNFQFKSLRTHVDAMAVKPPDLAARLDLMAGGDPAAAALELRSLFDEVREIVRRELPDVEVDVPWLPAPP